MTGLAISLAKLDVTSGYGGQVFARAGSTTDATQAGGNLILMAGSDNSNYGGTVEMRRSTFGSYSAVRVNWQLPSSGFWTAH